MNTIWCRETGEIVNIRNGRCVGGDCETVTTRRGPDGVVTDGKTVIYCRGMRPRPVDFEVIIRVVMEERRVETGEWHG